VKNYDFRATADQKGFDEIETRAVSPSDQAVGASCCWYP